MPRAPKNQLQLPVTRHDARVESRRLMERLRADAARIASEFGLCYRSIRAERPDVHEHYGVCYSDGTIRIRLRHAVTGKPLRYSSLVDTLCHELAHLKYFDHSERFWAFFEQLLGWCRQQGIYQPAEGPAGREPPAPGPAPTERQLPLFGDPRLRAIIAR